MKNLLILFILMSLLFTACSPAATGGQGSGNNRGGGAQVQGDAAGPGDDPGPQGRPESQDEPGDGQVQEPVEVTWDTSPETVVVSATIIGGFVMPSYFSNYIPDAQIFGDGRLLWTLYRDNGSRVVLEGQLSQAELAGILEQIEAAGFFSWEDRYANQLVADAPDKCLGVRQLDQVKQVCEYVEGAPAEFHTLYDWISAGAGAEGTPYTPERAYVTSEAFGTTADPVSGLVLSWEETDQVSLGDLSSGSWLEGAALEQAWRVVNAPGGGIVQEGDTYYQLSVQIPGVSYQAPPGS